MATGMIYTNTELFQLLRIYMQKNVYSIISVDCLLDVKDFRGHDADNCVFFLFGAVPDVGTVMPSRHVRQSDVNMIDRWTSADQLAS